MRTKLSKIAHIPLILIIGAIGVQTITSCSGDDGGGGGGLSACKEGTVAIGDQIWQKCNSDAVPSTGNYACYDNKESNCAIYGRLYSWAAAMALPSECDSTSCADRINKPYHKGICPSGWHIPSNAEWTELLKFVEGEKGIVGDHGYKLEGYDFCEKPQANCVCEEPGTCYVSQTAGKYLKSAIGWNDYAYDWSVEKQDWLYASGNGVDAYGFAALPGGIYSGSQFYFVGQSGGGWISSESGTTKAPVLVFHKMYNDAIWGPNNKSDRISVRCVKD